MTGARTLQRLRRFLLPSLAVLAFVSSACSGSGTAAHPPEGDQVTSGPVRELTSVGALRDAFNADAGSTRLILLISPT